MLVDTGPLVALVDKNDKNHSVTVGTAARLSGEVLETTWPCLTEASYLLYTLGGYSFQDRLWLLRRTGRLLLLDITADEATRMDALMAQYRDVPMDLADASLVAVAEIRGLRRLFTLDSDFYIFRMADGSVLEVVR